MVKMKGVVVPTITPFTADDQIDVDAIYRLVNYLVDNGVDSIYPNGTTGEMLKLSCEERKLVAKASVDAAADRIPVFVQVGASTTKETLDLAEHALSIGAAGIGVVTPQFFGVNHREMVNYYTTVANALPEDFAVYLYNIPQCAGNDITPEVIEDVLAATKNVVGIKYSWTDFIRFNKYLQCGNGTFDAIVGPDRLFLPGLAIGCAGVVSGCSQCYPAPFVDVYKHFMNGDIKAAQKAQVQATELCEIVKAGANMGYFKAALEYNGLGVMHMRAPALDITAEEKKNLFKALDDYHAKYGK